MPMHEAIDGIVVRVRDMGNCDRYLSLLTAERGRIPLLAKGSHSLHSTQAAVSQMYTYGNYEYYRKGSMNILKGGSVIQPFYSLSADIDRLNLAAYLCDLTVELTDEGEEAGDMLRLLLNSLHAVSRELRPQELVKGAFELRAAVLSGYAPDLSGCAGCGRAESELFCLDVMNGALICRECRAQRNAAVGRPSSDEELREAEIVGLMTPAVLAAFRYCAVAPLERLLSFDLHDRADREQFSRLCELYLLSHIGHGFDSLQFYHNMRAPQASADKGNQHELFQQNTDHTGV